MTAIKSKIRTVLDYPVKGIAFRDISTLISDPEGLQLVVKGLQSRYEKNNEFDIDLLLKDPFGTP